MTDQTMGSWRKPHYAWVVAGVTFLTLMVAAGFRSSPGVLLVPVEQEFGWSRGTTSFAVGVNLIFYGFIGPFAAALMDRFGIRRVMLAAIALAGSGAVATLFMRQSWQFVAAWGIFVGAGTGVTANVLSAMIVSRWFSARRGLVMGLLTAAAAGGQLLFLPLLANFATNFGWRSVALTIGGVTVILLPIVALLMRDRPEDVGLAPYGELPSAKPAAPRPPAASPLTAAFEALGMGLRSRDFILLTTAFFICGGTTNGLMATHLIPACIDNGLAEVTGASLLAFMAIFNFIGTTGSGWLSDRMDNRILLSAYYGLRGLSLLYLPYAFDSVYGLSVFAVFYGLDWIATVPPTVRLTTDMFGKEKTAIMYGWVYVIHSVGGAAAAFLAGVVRAEMGSYVTPFMAAGALCLIASGMVMLIGSRETRGTPSGLPTGQIAPPQRSA